MLADLVLPCLWFSPRGAGKCPQTRTAVRKDLIRTSSYKAETSTITAPKAKDKVMSIPPFHRGRYVLTVGMALAVAALVGCSKHEASKHGEPSHGDHAKTEPVKNIHDMHGGHDGGRTE